MTPADFVSTQELKGLMQTSSGSSDPVDPIASSVVFDLAFNSAPIVKPVPL